MKLILSIVLISFTFFGVAQTTKTFENESYTFDYPTEWSIDEHGLGMDVSINTPTVENDNFNENFNVISQNLTGVDVDFEQFVEISLAQYPQFLEDHEIISSTTLKKGGQTFQEVVVKGILFDTNMTFIQRCYVFEGEKALVLTFTHLTENPQFVEQANQILDSFIVK